MAAMAFHVKWKTAWNSRGGRRNRKFTGRQPHVPEEIVRNILSWLPVKSLLRFRCVNKHWNSIITDPNFTLSSDRIARTVFVTAEDPPSICFHFVDNDAHIQRFSWRRNEDFIRRYQFEKKDKYDFIQRFQFEEEDVYDYKFSSLGGSCNGLLLVVLGKSFFLWNPSTRCMRKVLELRRICYLDYRVVSGLCFDSFNNDYKVVIGLAHQTHGHGDEFVIVASLKEKQWRQVQFPYRVSTMESGPVINGFLHLQVTEGSDRIVAFDPKTDEFKEIPMPQAKNQDGDLEVLGLGVLDGCLCMAHWVYKSAFVHNVKVLAMKEYGVKESWTAMFEISNLHEGISSFTSLRPLLLTSNGEVLLMMDNKIRIYNPKEMTYKFFEFKRCYCYIVSHGDIFVGSLVSPTGFEWDKKQHERTLLNEIIWL